MYYRHVYTYSTHVFTFITLIKGILPPKKAFTSKKVFTTLIWNIQQSLYLDYFQIILPVLFCVYKISIYYFIIELQYNHVLTL